MLDLVNEYSKNPRLILFLGATIGNMQPREALSFCQELYHQLREGDMLLIGFDLRKDPYMILNAYNDQAGLTKAFNINLLKRINAELRADFNISNFVHFPIYDPVTGACKSYLISTQKQTVTLQQHEFYFAKDEPIFMEISQKYTPEQIEELALKSGFSQIKCFSDSNNWFTDVLWVK